MGKQAKRRLEWAVVSARGKRYPKPDEARARKAAVELNRHVADLEARPGGAPLHHLQAVPYRVEVREVSEWVPAPE